MQNSSRRRLGYLAVVIALIGVVLLAGTQAASLAQATPVPPDDLWDTIQSTGTLRVGTSGDYPPFEYYNPKHQLTGFDIALMLVVGEELGLEVEFYDYAFEGLPAALTAGQIDAAIAAISVTPARMQEVDFSHVYFVSEEVVVASESSPITNVVTLADLAPYRVGVQRGSVFQDQLEDELVATGLMPETNLFLYPDFTTVADDLVAGRVDLLVTNDATATELQRAQNLQIVGDELEREHYAIALPKGATGLREAVNDALDELDDDGVIAGLLEAYLNIEQETGLPTDVTLPASPTSAAPSAGTSTGTSTTPSATCVDNMAYIADLSYDDRNMTAPPVVPAGQTFRKGWQVQNTGTCTWDAGYLLAFVQGNSPAANMGSSRTPLGQTVSPGATFDLYVNLVAPTTAGVHQGVWQLVNAGGAAFGEKLWAGITVQAPNLPVVPTPTASPNLNFTVDKNNLRAGECTNLRWDVRNVREVYVYADGEDWSKHGVAGQSSRQVCPQQSTNYNLRVVYTDGRTETRSLRIDVQGAPHAPQVNRFTVEPDGTVPVNTCVNVTWDVGGDTDHVVVRRNGNVLWDNAPVRATNQDCPPGPGEYTYNLEAHGSGGTSQASDHLTVVENAPVKPSIDGFSINPPQIEPGQCVAIAWSTTNAASTRLSRNGQLLVDNGPVNSIGQQDCPPESGTVTYQLEARSSSGGSASLQSSIVVQAPAQPTEQPPAISQFSADRSSMAVGECVNLNWRFGGTSLAAARLLRNSDTLQGDVPTSGSYQDCPQNPGDYTYQLIVDSEFSGSAQQSTTVNVTQAQAPQPEPTATRQPPAAAQPVIDRFNASPTEVSVGACVNLEWSFSGQDLAAATITRNGQVIDSDMPQQGSYQDCLNDPRLAGSTVSYQLKVDSEFGGSAIADQAVTVADAAAADAPQRDE